MFNKFRYSPEGEAGGAAATQETTETTEQTTLLDKGGEATTTSTEQTTEQTAPTYVDLLPEIYKDNPTMTRFKTLEEQMKSHLELRELQSKSIPLPGEDATEEDWNTVYDRLGRPQQPLDYNVDIPENSGITENEVNWYKEAMHQSGASARMAEQFWAKHTEFREKMATDHAAQLSQELQKSEETLMREWNNDFTANLNAGSNFFLNNFSPETQNKMKIAGIHNDPNFIKDMLNLANTVSEDTSKGTVSKSGITPQGIKEEIKALYADGMDAYWKDPAKQRKMTELTNELAALDEVQ